MLLNTHITGSAAILEKKFLVRRAFKFKGVKYKNFEEVVPKNIGWNIDTVAELVRDRKIHPFDDSINVEVFHEIVYMKKRSPVGVSMADTNTTVLNGKLDASLEGTLIPDEIKAASRMFSILAKDPQKDKPVQTYEAREYPYDVYKHKAIEVPTGANGNNTDPIPPAGPKPAPEAGYFPTIYPPLPHSHSENFAPNF